MFLQDSDTLTRQLSELRVRRSAKFVSIDIRRLYPSIDLQKCIEAVHQFCVESVDSLGLPAAQRSRRLEELNLATAIRRVILLEMYCRFDDKIYKFRRGFPTGIANGREMAEIYRHMIERSVLQRFSNVTAFSRGYVDDVCVVLNSDLHGAREFISAYQDCMREHDLQITFEISHHSCTMLDLYCSKGRDWQRTGFLDLTVYQKPNAAHLFIPQFSEHPAHVLRAWIRGELIRYVKRSSSVEYYSTMQRLFVHRLTARGYTAAFLQPIFDGVRYSDRWVFLQPRPSERESTANQPLVLALVLPHTQRLDALKVPAALFYFASRWLHVDYVPAELRTANFKLARSTIGRFASRLIHYKFPKQGFSLRI